MGISHKLTALALASSLVFTTTSAYAYKVGIAMPYQAEAHWYEQGFNLEKMLKDKGYETILMFGGDADVSLQQKQLVRMVEKQNVDAMIVASIEGGALVDALKPALEKHIPVISYDRLVTGTDAVTYYATFDNEMAGALQGKYLIKALHPSAQNPVNIEVFHGSLDDNNAQYFYKGAFKVMYPYLMNGSIVIKSGEKSPEDTNIPGWSTDLSNKRMGALLEKVGYGPKDGQVKLHGILSPADCISLGVITALKKAGYTKENFPVITGQDATPDAIQAIRDGYMGMTVYKSPKDLASHAIKMLDEISHNQKVEVNDTETYNNGVKDMQSYLCVPKEVTIENIDSYMN